MKPVKFKGSNTTFAKNQPPYAPLPAHLDVDAGVVVSCWKVISWGERLRIFFTGRVWLRQMTFNRPLQPVSLQGNKPELCESMEWRIVSAEEKKA